MKSVDCGIKLRSAHVAPFLQCCALQPITVDSVELRNAVANQRRSDESSLKLSLVERAR